MSNDDSARSTAARKLRPLSRERREAPTEMLASLDQRSGISPPTEHARSPSLARKVGQDLVMGVDRQ
jgi:hypothetical protein